MAQRNYLTFSGLSREDVAIALQMFCRQRRKSLAIYQASGELTHLVQELRREIAQTPNIRATIVKDEKSLLSVASRVDGVFLFINNERQLSKALTNFVSSENLFIWAPRTNHYYKSRPALVQSIPKCGTHLVFECLRAFGFNEPGSFDLPNYTAELQDGHFYNLQHMHITYLSKQYQRIRQFVDNLCRAPIVFIIRDPRDASVSLAEYLATKEDYHLLSALFSRMSREERIERVISGNYPIPVYINDHFAFEGDISSLFLAYRIWWANYFSNVWLVRFEDLVGPRGGGDASTQLASIWGLQLALHVPGSPTEFADRVFSEEADTFRRGQIGDYLIEFSREHHKLFDKVNPRTLSGLGYADRWRVLKSFTLRAHSKKADDARTLVAALKREFSIHAQGCFSVRQLTNELTRSERRQPGYCLEIRVESIEEEVEESAPMVQEEPRVLVVVETINPMESEDHRGLFRKVGNKEDDVVVHLPHFSPQSVEIVMNTLAEKQLLRQLTAESHAYRYNSTFCGEIENIAQGSSPEPDVTRKQLAGNDKDGSLVAELVGSSPRFNFVKVGRKFVAAAKSMGPVELFGELLGARDLPPFLFVASTLAEVSEKSKAVEMYHPQVRLVEQRGNYNLAKAGDVFIAIAKDLGPVNLFEERIGERDLPPYILVSEDLASLRARIPTAAKCPNDDNTNS